MIPISKVRDLISKHEMLEKELSSGQIDKSKYAEKSKEYSDLNEIIDVAKEFNSYEKDKNDLEKIVEDKSSDLEMKELARLELSKLIKKMKIT